jgi:hypothetical protein
MGHEQGGRAEPRNRIRRNCGTHESGAKFGLALEKGRRLPARRRLGTNCRPYVTGLSVKLLVSLQTFLRPGRSGVDFIHVSASSGMIASLFKSPTQQA